MSYVKIHHNVFQTTEDLIKTGLYKNEQEAISDQNDPLESKEMFVSDVIEELFKTK